MRSVAAPVRKAKRKPAAKPAAVRAALVERASQNTLAANPLVGIRRKDILAAIPTSRNAAGIQALIPGMNTGTDSGGITGVLTGGAGTIHGGRGDDSRTYADGINMGWAGGSAGGGNMPQVSSSQEVVLIHRKG